MLPRLTNPEFTGNVYLTNCKQPPKNRELCVGLTNNNEATRYEALVPLHLTNYVVFEKIKEDLLKGRKVKNIDMSWWKNNLHNVYCWKPKHEVDRLFKLESKKKTSNFWRVIYNHLPQYKTRAEKLKTKISKAKTFGEQRNILVNDFGLIRTRIYQNITLDELTQKVCHGIVFCMTEEKTVVVGIKNNRPDIVDDYLMNTKIEVARVYRNLVRRHDSDADSYEIHYGKRKASDEDFNNRK